MTSCLDEGSVHCDPTKRTNPPFHVNTTQQSHIKDSKDEMARLNIEAHDTNWLVQILWKSFLYISYKNVGYDTNNIMT